MSPEEFTDTTAELRGELVLAMAKELEQFWPRRVHVGVAVILVGEDEQPEAVCFTDTMANSPAIIEVLYASYRAKREELYLERVAKKNAS